MKMFETRIQTYWDDADPAGRVYYAHFFRFVDCAETELFRASGAEKMNLYDEYGVWTPRGCALSSKARRPCVWNSRLFPSRIARCWPKATSRPCAWIARAHDLARCRPPYERFLRGLRRIVTVWITCRSRNQKRRDIPIIRKEKFLCVIFSFSLWSCS